MTNYVRYVVCGNRDNRQVFYEVDHSSMYPYASESSHRTTSDINEAISWLDSCKPGGYASMVNPKVCKIEYVPVDISEIVEKKNKLTDYVSNLNKDERELLKKLLTSG